MCVCMYIFAGISKTMNIIINYEYMNMCTMNTFSVPSLKLTLTLGPDISREKFHCRQYSSPVLFNVGTIEVSAAIGGSGGDVITVVTIGSIAGGSDVDPGVAIDVLATRLL